MNQTYHVTMDNGAAEDVRASSAAEAMGKALNWHRGHCVTACYAGGVLDPEHRDLFARMDYPILPHDPLPVVAPPPPKPACTLFDDAEIVAESKQARKHFEKDHAG